MASTPEVLPEPVNLSNPYFHENCKSCQSSSHSYNSVNCLQTPMAATDFSLPEETKAYTVTPQGSALLWPEGTIQLSRPLPQHRLYQGEFGFLKPHQHKDTLQRTKTMATTLDFITRDLIAENPHPSQGGALPQPGTASERVGLTGQLRKVCTPSQASAWATSLLPVLSLNTEAQAPRKLPCSTLIAQE